MENKPFECFKRNRTIPIKVKLSFLTCGITNNTDCSEDYLFTGWDKLKEDGLVEDYKLIIKDTTKEDEEDENNSIDVKSSSDSEMASSDFDIEENSSEK